jgi:hypothetical protein
MAGLLLGQLGCITFSVFSPFSDCPYLNGWRAWPFHPTYGAWYDVWGLRYVHCYASGVLIAFMLQVRE